MKGILICVLPDDAHLNNLLVYRYFFNIDLLFQSGDESCWLYEDDKGRKLGPHSLLELHSWHHYGYFPDSLMVNSEFIIS
jgi:hypothetical protein